MGEPGQDAELERRGSVCDADCDDAQGLERESQPRRDERSAGLSDRAWSGRSWPSEPAVGRVVNGLASRVDRLKALGNGQVPRVACTAWRILSANAGVKWRLRHDTHDLS